VKGGSRGGGVKKVRKEVEARGTSVRKMAGRMNEKRLEGKKDGKKGAPSQPGSEIMIVSEENGLGRLKRNQGFRRGCL